jgi:hypothetical protein
MHDPPEWNRYLGEKLEAYEESQSFRTIDVWWRLEIR